MNIDYSKRYDKQFSKLRDNEQSRVVKAVTLFIKDPSNQKLRNHVLKGQWPGYRSISVGGDLRIHYKELNNNRVYFVAIGTHAQLYK